MRIGHVCPCSSMHQCMMLSCMLKQACSKGAGSWIWQDQSDACFSARYAGVGRAKAYDTCEQFWCPDRDLCKAMESLSISPSSAKDIISLQVDQLFEPEWLAAASTPTFLPSFLHLGLTFGLMITAFGVEQCQTTSSCV